MTEKMKINLNVGIQELLKVVKSMGDNHKEMKTYFEELGSAMETVASVIGPKPMVQASLFSGQWDTEKPMEAPKPKRMFTKPGVYRSVERTQYAPLVLRDSNGIPI